MTQYIEDNYPPIQSAGLNTKKNVTIGGTLTVTGAQTFVGNTTQNGNEVVTGTSTVTGGIVGPGTQSTVFHSGGVVEFGVLTTNYHHTQVVSTDTYICEVFIPVNTTITGISVLNGGTTSASQNTYVGLANSAGTVVASMGTTTTTAQGTANTYQQLAFSTTYSAIGPAKYFILVQGSNTTGYFATHHVGNYGATLKTTETYGTFVTTASYSTTTFTADQGPIADTY